MSSVVFPLIIMFIFIIIGIVTITVLLSYMRSNRLVIRRDIDGKSIIEGYYWMLPKKSRKDGTIYWVTVPWQKKLKIQEPPNEVMDINSRGKKWVEVFRLSEDEYCFIKDTGLNPNTFMCSGEKGEKKTIKDVFKPFSLVQRDTIIQQYKKANAEQQKDKIMSLINNIPVIVLGMVVIVALIYSGEIANAFVKVGGQADGLITKASKLMQSTTAGISEIVPQQSSGISKAGEEPPTD